MATLAERADERLKGKDPREDNMLKLASDARKASTRYAPWLTPGPPLIRRGKVALAAANIARIYKETTPDKEHSRLPRNLGTPKASDGKDKPETARRAM